MKIRKIIISVALCLMITFVGLGATACSSNVNLSDEQIKKIMSVVDHSDEFMYDSLELMEKSNNKLSREEAYLLIQSTSTKLMTNYEKDWENLKVKLYRDDELAQLITIKKLSETYNNNYAVYGGFANSVGDCYVGKNPINGEKTYWKNHGSGSDDTEEYPNSIIAVIKFFMNNVLSMFTPLAEDSIIGMTKDENGNFIISTTQGFVGYDYSSTYVQYEIDGKGKLTKISGSGIYDYKQNEESDEYNTGSIDIRIEYDYSEIPESTVINYLTNAGFDLSKIA